MRTMPSVTLTTVPTLRASVADWNFSMRALIRSLISDALMDISILLLRALAPPNLVNCQFVRAVPGGPSASRR